MMLAEIGQGLILGCTIVSCLMGVVGIVISWVALNKKQEVQISPQPLTVEMVKALHEQFANKQDFERHVEKNGERHDQLFKGINQVSRETSAEIDRRFSDINKSADMAREKIHKRLNRISIGLANLCGRVGAQMPSEEEEL